MAARVTLDYVLRCRYEEFKNLSIEQIMRRIPANTDWNGTAQEVEQAMNSVRR